MRGFDRWTGQEERGQSSDPGGKRGPPTCSRLHSKGRAPRERRTSTCGRRRPLPPRMPSPGWRDWAAAFGGFRSPSGGTSPPDFGRVTQPATRPVALQVSGPEPTPECPPRLNSFGLAAPGSYKRGPLGVFFF